jgi:hypothetical protein
MVRHHHILKSFVGVLFGLILLLGSFVGIFINEGTTDFAEIMRKAPIVAPAQANPNANGKLVSLTGPIAASPALGDPFSWEIGAAIVAWQLVV